MPVVLNAREKRILRRLGILFPFLIAMTAWGQTIQAPSPKQGRPGEILPWTRFRPRTESYSPTTEEKQQIQSKIDQLGAMIRGIHADDSLLVDVQIFHEAARWILTFPAESFRNQAVANTLQVLDQGLQRG